MDIATHHKKFRSIVKKYSLDSKASEISSYLTKASTNIVSAEKFASDFAMEIEDSVIFLSWIERGIQFKESLPTDRI